MSSGQTDICSRWISPSLLLPDKAPRTIGAIREGWTPFLLCGRRSDRISAGIVFVALVSLGTLLAHCAAIAFFAFFALRSLGTRRTWIALRTFKTSRESERCNQRTYQG
jgi:hypothetical protein